MNVDGEDFQFPMVEGDERLTQSMTQRFSRRIRLRGKLKIR